MKITSKIFKKNKFDFVSHVYLCTPALIKKKTFRLGVYDHSHKHTIALFFFWGGGIGVEVLG